jgi:hypothetical protein
MRTSVVLALLGFASAATLKQNCGCAAPLPAPVCAPVAPQSLCDLQVGKSKQALLGAASREGSFAALASETAGSTTNIGAQQIVIPDRHTVTDQTKVSEYCAKGSNNAQSCEIAKRTFDIAGSITVSEKYNDSSKGENAENKDSEGASQTRSRSQVANNLCAKATIPCTCACPATCQ